MKTGKIVKGILAGWIIFVAFSSAVGAESRTLRLATGSPYELGLIDEIYRAFKKKVPCKLTVVKAGSGKSLFLLKKGEVDVVLVHAPWLELKAVKEGWALNRTYIGANDFVILGPKGDPAGIRGCKDVMCAYRRIARRGCLFFSRGDNSGTHRRELSIWRRVGITPSGPWYRITHKFMMATLLEADRQGGYFMSDRSTYIVAKKKYPHIRLKILFEGDPILINRYHALIGNPKVNPVNYELAKSFVDFLASKKGQAIIGTYGKKRFGASLYFPRSHKFGKIVIFHAGSLSVPFSRMEEAFENTHEGVDVVRESHGSVRCARLITDLGRPCDIMASADVEVIRRLLYPRHASWWVSFATNSLVIAYTRRSRFSKEINQDNWYNILRKPDVSFGYSDPNLDPCGYRALILMKLAAKFYKNREIASLPVKGIVRPRSVELIGLLETGNLDYAFEYKSVAVQHRLRYIELPKEINLSDPSHNDYYRSVWVDVRGKKKGERLKIYGKAIVYAATILSNAPHKGFAREFMEFLLDEKWGLRILKECGQMPLSPPTFYPSNPGIPVRTRSTQTNSRVGHLLKCRRPCCHSALALSKGHTFGGK